MTLVAFLLDDDGRELIVLGAPYRDFAPEIIKWHNSYFLRTDYEEDQDKMTTTYRHVSFEDFSDAVHLTIER